MVQHELVNEIIKVCKYFKIIKNNVNEYFIEKKIVDGLNDIIFVENLLNIFYRKLNSKNLNRNIDIKEFKNLLIELEKTRLNLEFKEEL